MAHAQKPDFVFRRNERVHLNRRGASVQSTTGSRGVGISGSSGSIAGYTMFRGSVNSTGYPLHSPVSPSLPFPCVTVCHHISTGLYKLKVLTTLRWREGWGGGHNHEKSQDSVRSYQHPDYCLGQLARYICVLMGTEGVLCSEPAWCSVSKYATAARFV